LPIYLELAHLAAVGEGERRVLVPRRGAERGAERRRQLPTGRRAGDLEEADRSVGADDAEGSVAVLDVGGGGLQKMRGHWLAGGDDGVGGFDRRAAAPRSAEHTSELQSPDHLV